ncbi:MAG: hypothetical protein ACK528_10315 [Alphaproteobacteria bacterium]|jgi:hypothetical protein
MSDLTEMWTALEQYQSRADANGHGESWKRMTTERTVDAVELAWFALTEVAGSSAWSASWAAAAEAADAADDAVWAATEQAEAEQHATRAIEYINKAMETQS